MPSKLTISKEVPLLTRELMKKNGISWGFMRIDRLGGGYGLHQELGVEPYDDDIVCIEDGVIFLVSKELYDRSREIILTVATCLCGKCGNGTGVFVNFFEKEEAGFPNVTSLFNSKSSMKNPELAARFVVNPDVPEMAKTVLKKNKLAVDMMRVYNCVPIPGKCSLSCIGKWKLEPTVRIMPSDHWLEMDGITFLVDWRVLDTARLVKLYVDKCDCGCGDDAVLVNYKPLEE